MRSIAGAILIGVAEQAFAHAHLVGFPHQEFVREVLMPASGVLVVLGSLLLVWGLFGERSGKGTDQVADNRKQASAPDL